jgi:hypothetical protein
MRFVIAGKAGCRVMGMVLCHWIQANAAPAVEEIPALTEQAAPADEPALDPLIPPDSATASAAEFPAAADLLPPVPTDIDGVPLIFKDLPTEGEPFPASAVSSPVEAAAAAGQATDEGAPNPGSSQGYFSNQLPLPGPPSGFSNVPAALPPDLGLGGDLLDGFSLSTSISGTYDSNPSLGYSAPGSPEGGDFFVTLGGGMGYRSTSADWTVGANYNGSYSNYFEQSELSGYNQSAGAMVNYEGGPLSAALNVGFNFGSGPNRYYSSVVEQWSLSYGLSARYRISPKTSLAANVSQAFTNASGGNSTDTGSFAMNASALWRYSALTEFGPGIRYTSETGESDRTSVGPTLNMTYKLAKKVSMTSQVGMEFAHYEVGGSSDPSLTASVGLNYRASRLWGMNLSLFRGTQANPTTAGGFDEITSLSLGYNRRIRRASLDLGMSYETNAAQTPDNGTGDRPDSDYLNYTCSLSMPVLAEKATGRVFISHRNQSGDNTPSAGDSTQTGFSLSWNF